MKSVPVYALNRVADAAGDRHDDRHCQTKKNREMAMASRKERVRKALIRTGPDRVPVFMWFHPSTARRLGRLLDIPAGAVAEAFGDDIRQTWVNNNYAMEGVVH